MLSMACLFDGLLATLMQHGIAVPWLLEQATAGMD